MSMNLHCDEVDLPQINTETSFQIYNENEGGTEGVKERLRNYFLARHREHVNESGSKAEAEEADWFLEHNLKKLDYISPQATFSVW